MTWEETVTTKKEEKKMLELIRITFFSGWTKQQVIDFTVGMILTIASFIFLIVFLNIFG